MAKLCVKKYVMFVWGLLECLLFSGVFFGWDWLIHILKYDGYFTTLCAPANATGHNITAFCAGDTRKSVASSAVTVFINSTNSVFGKEGVPSTISFNHSQYIRYFGNFTDCEKQEDKFSIFYCSIHFAMNTLTLLAGIFFDKYGTMRTRLVAVLLFTVSTLMMTFTSSGVPWLVVPAMSLVALGGNMILMTNLQISNLHCSRRYTVMSIYIGAHDASAIVVLLMKLSHIGNINVQTSFMFLTISIVPLLVSTIAFLPKIRIPWPLPAHYGKKRGVQVDELVLRQQQIAWQRKMSAANSKSKAKPPFHTVGLTSLFLCSVVWFSINQIKPIFYIRNIRTILKSAGTDEFEARTYEDHNTIIQTLGIFCAPLAGLIMDRQGTPRQGASPYVRQMENVLTSVILTSIASGVMSLLSVLPFVQLQIATFVGALIVRVFTMATTAAFLTHVHFPQEHFGKLFGVSTFTAGLFGACLYPLRHILHTQLCGDPFYIHVGFICVSLLTIVHPVNLWRHCHLGWIKDMSASELERRRKSSCAEPLVANQKPLGEQGDADGNTRVTTSSRQSHGNTSMTDVQSQGNLSASNHSLSPSPSDESSLKVPGSAQGSKQQETEPMAAAKPSTADGADSVDGDVNIATEDDL